ncbi:hypothetical protein MAR_025964 [Mya arenaria]|uniref:Nephrocystin 3-like N-terminal domain-containing protein n=1 Tax=Mya arenaria TaxID=6604 RepID=A0ABY7ES73_MYAAR|nr:hypothetical protein MAR_025964 [Mya arenaria]
MHGKINNDLASIPACTQQCSENDGGQTSKWCDHCIEWKKLLDTYKRQKSQINTQRTKSWLWSTSYEEIIDIFLPVNWTGSFNISDISCMCHLWKNCKMFDIAENTMQRLMKVRNEYFAHSSEVTLTIDKKMEVFDVLFDLVAEKDMQAYLDINKCRRELKEIQDKEYVPVLEAINELKKEIRNNNAESKENRQEFNQAFQRLLDKTDEKQVATKETWILQKEFQNDLEAHIQECNQAFKRLLEKTDEINVATKETFYSLRQNYKCVCAILLFAGLAILFSLKPFPSLHDSGSDLLPNIKIGPKHNRGCLSEQYTFPFPQDLPLLNFLGHHRKLVGREWLFRELEDSVLKNDNLRGVMFLANIGYGKSAIIRHLLCAGEGEKGYELRQHVKAFHVCKFDIRSTRLPSRFVRRLIGFLATASAEYGSIIEYLGNNSLFYDQSACESDIKACFDLAVTQPLQQITGDMEPVLFAIDALDECYDSNKETNPIMDILQSRLSKLPKWFKVVITARNGTISAWFKQHVLLQNLQFSDSNNTADIKEFISESNITNTAKEALYQSKGNFLYVNKLLENKDSIENYKDLPQSLEEIYEENFSRHFGTTERYFDTAKRILEIIAVEICRHIYQKPMNIAQVEAILLI